MTKEELRAWIESSDLSREWIAKEVGVSKRTVDGWLQNKPITETASILLDRIRAEHAIAQVRFNPLDWGKIESAMKLAGYNDAIAFIVDSAREMSSDPSKLMTNKKR